MDVRDWPLDQLMSLPDWCFGRRWPVMVGVESLISTVAYSISDAALPETCVIWELVVEPMAYTGGLAPTRIYCGLKLGDQLPAAGAAYDVLEDLFPGSGYVLGVRRLLLGGLEVRRLRFPVRTGGRRLVAAFWQDSFEALDIMACLVISSVPREVPDWVISGRA